MLAVDIWIDGSIAIIWIEGGQTRSIVMSQSDRDVFDAIANYTRSSTLTQPLL